MKLKSMKRGAKSVTYSAIFQGEDDTHEDRTVTLKGDACVPLPEFDESLTGLAEVAADWMDGTKKWGEPLTVTGFSIARTTKGTRSMAIHYKRTFSKAAESTYSTPYVRIDEPEDGEDRKPLPKQEHMEAIGRALRCAEEYVEGKRAQMTFDEIAEADPKPQDSEPSLID